MNRGRPTDWRLLAILIVMSAAFAGAVAYPQAIPYALIWVAVIAGAAFVSPPTALFLGAYGLALSIIGGFVSDTADTVAFWVRMVAYGLIAVIALLLSLQRSRREADLLERATTDELTGLATRKLLIERLEAQMEVRTRGGVAAVLYADLDSFKQVNDTLGHGAGDEVLRKASERLTACTRPADTLARFGGDEFVIACPSVAGEPEVAALCSRIIEAFAPTFRAGESDVSVGITIGVAIAQPGSGAGPTALIDAADLALTECKAGSPGTFRIVEL